MTYYSHFNLPMDRSSAFGPTPQHYSRTFRTRFRFAFAPEGLKLALQGNSPDHAKGTPSPIKDRALTACKHLVSGSFPPLPGFLSPFPHGTGSLSLSKTYLAFDSGLPKFTPDFSCRTLLGWSAEETSVFPYGAVTHSGAPFQALLVTVSFVTSWQIADPPADSHDPTYATPACLHVYGLGCAPFRSPLLRRSLSISFPPGT